MIQNTNDEDVGIIYLKHSNKARMKIQERECRKEMRENGIRVASVFCDIDSGTAVNPGLSAALQYCETNPVDFVMSYDTDNFGTTEDELSAAYHSFYTKGTESLFLYGNWQLE